MLGLFHRRPTPEKLRQRVARLERQHKYRHAAELQAQLCQLASATGPDWTRLAALARAAELPALELSARMEAAKFTRLKAEEWLALADLARTAGDPEQALTAEFRAADAWATIGESDKAIALFDRILAADPNHQMARRLKHLIVAKRERRAAQSQLREGSDPGPSLRDSDTEEITLTFLRKSGVSAPAKPMGLSYEDPEDLFDANEGTRPGWMAPLPSFGTEAAPTPARYVCAPQPWPTVLDRRALLFIGKTEELEGDLAELIEERTMAADGLLLVQGQPSELLYCLRQGKVSVQRSRDRDYDLGQISADHFFGELGALMGFPSTTSVLADEAVTLGVVTHERVAAHVRTHQGVPTVVRQLRGWYLDTVFQICPLSRHDSDNWREQQDQIRWVTFAKDEDIVQQDREGGLYVMLAGFARVAVTVAGQTHALGFLCPGDLCGELDPSPVTVTAASTVSALRINRQHLDQLPPAAQADFEERIAHCRVALAHVV